MRVAAREAEVGPLRKRRKLIGAVSKRKRQACRIVGTPAKWATRCRSLSYMSLSLLDRGLHLVRIQDVHRRVLFRGISPHRCSSRRIYMGKKKLGRQT